MIFYRVLRETQARSNLLVSQSPADQFNELLFAPAEFGTVPPLKIQR